MNLKKGLINKVNEVGKVAVYNIMKVIPEGDYDLEIIYIDAGNTKNGSGYRVIVTFQVLNKEYQGTIIQTTFSLENPDKRVEWISRVLFYKMSISVGIKEDQFNDNFDTDLLVSKAVKAHVVVEPAKGEYPKRNRVSEFIICKVE